MTEHVNPKPKSTADSARKDELELRRLEVELREKEIQVARMEREEEQTLASDESNLVYTFYDTVSEKSVKACIDTLSKWSRKSKGKPIKIILNSPGGNVIDGLALYDYLRLIANKHRHHITVAVLGQGASMAGILLCAGDKRIIGNSGFILIHEITSASWGSMGAVADDVAFTGMLWDRLTSILASRSKLSVEEIKRKAHRRDWWLSAQSALELGFVDEIIT